MAIVNQYCEFLCGWQSGDPWEGEYFNDDVGGNNTSMSIATLGAGGVPSAPAAIAMGTYCVLVNKPAGHGGTDTSAYVNLSAHKAGSIGFMFYPKTNPTIDDIHIGPGIDDGSLNGFGVFWGTDKKLRIKNYVGTTIAGPTVNTFDATAPAWYWIAMKWDNVSEFAAVQVWDSSRALITTGGYADAIGAHVYQVLNFSALTSLRWGDTWDDGAAEYWMGNVYLQKGGSWAPIAPNFGTRVPTSLNLNNTGWTREDGVDNTVAEPQAIDEAPPNDTAPDYLKQTNYASSGAQRYAIASGLIPAGQNILAAGATARMWQVAGPSDSLPNVGQQTLGIRVGTSNLGGTARVIVNDVFTRIDSVWGYQHGIFRHTPPPVATSNGWTSADVDGILPLHTGVVEDGENRLSQLTVYAAWGDEYLLDTPVNIGATLNEALDTSETGVDVNNGALFTVGLTYIIPATNGEAEKIYVSSIAGNTLTVIRGFAGTSATTHSSGDAVKALTQRGVG